MVDMKYDSTFIKQQPVVFTLSSGGDASFSCKNKESRFTTGTEGGSEEQEVTCWQHILGGGKKTRIVTTLRVGKQTGCVR